MFGTDIIAHMARSSVQAEARREELAKLLSVRRQVSTAELARMFGVSQMTIRRDFEELERSGAAVPCYGGAMAA